MITLFTWLFILYLKNRNNFKYVITLIGGIFVFSYLIFHLRVEYLYVPAAFCFSLFVAINFRDIKSKTITSRGLLLMAITFVLTISMLFYESELSKYFNPARIKYSKLAINQHSTSSLGVSLIVSQPLYIRIFLGTAFLFIFPIPFWNGLQLNSAYLLFKTFNVIHFYFFFPLLFTSILAIYKNNRLQSPSILFLCCLTIGFPVGVAVTSLETRHLGTFLAPMFILSLIPKIDSSKYIKNYYKYLLFFIGLIISVHITWAILKM